MRKTMTNHGRPFYRVLDEIGEGEGPTGAYLVEELDPLAGASDEVFEKTVHDHVTDVVSRPGSHPAHGSSVTSRTDLQLGPDPASCT